MLRVVAFCAALAITVMLAQAVEVKPSRSLAADPMFIQDTIITSTRRHEHRRAQTGAAVAARKLVPTGPTWVDSLGVAWNPAGGMIFNWDRNAMNPARTTAMWPTGAGVGGVRAQVMTKSFPPTYTLLSQVHGRHRTVFYHSTLHGLQWPAGAPTEPLWMTNDLEQSIAAPLERMAGNVRRAERLAPFYSYEITVKEPVNLYPLPPCASTGTELIRDEAARLNAQCTDGSRAPACLSTKVLMSLKGDVGHIKTVCAAWAGEGRYDGWRSPWDQDEFMICPHALNKLNIPGRVPTNQVQQQQPRQPRQPDAGNIWTCDGTFPYRTLSVHDVPFDPAAQFPATHPHTTLGGNYVCRDYRALFALIDARNQALIAMSASPSGPAAFQRAQTAVDSAIRHLNGLNGLWGRYAASPHTAGLLSFEYVVSTERGTRFHAAAGLGHYNACTSRDGRPPPPPRRYGAGLW